MNRRSLLVGIGATTITFTGCLSDDPADPDSSRNDGGADDLGDSGRSDGDSVTAHFDEDASRPECEKDSETIEAELNGETHEFETASTIPYPDPPTAFDREEIIDYIESFEEAYVTHDVLCTGRGSGHVLRVGYYVQDSETFDWYDDVVIVFLLRAGGAVSGLDADGYPWEAELPYEGVVYAVDETGVARSDFDDVHELERDEFESHAPDPLERGSLVAAFG